MSLRFLQINLNRSWAALNLLKQRVLESQIGLSIVSEQPREVVVSNRWFSSYDGLATIMWNLENLRGQICRLVRAGNGFVFVKCGEINVISCYMSRCVPDSRFEDLL